MPSAPPSSELVSEIAAAVDAYREDGSITRLLERIDEAARTSDPDTLAAAVEPYRMIPEVAGPAYEHIVAAKPDDARALVTPANAYWVTGRGPEQVAGSMLWPLGPIVPDYPLKDLRLYTPRWVWPPSFKHTEQYAQLLRSIKESGIFLPLLVLPDGQVIDGQHRYACAKEVGLESVPVRIIDVPLPLGAADQLAIPLKHPIQSDVLSESQIIDANQDDDISDAALRKHIPIEARQDAGADHVIQQAIAADAFAQARLKRFKAKMAVLPAPQKALWPRLAAAIMQRPIVFASATAAGLLLFDAMLLVLLGCLLWLLTLLLLRAAHRSFTRDRLLTRD